MSTESFSELVARVREGDRTVEGELGKRYLLELLELVRIRLRRWIRDEKDVLVVGSIFKSLLEHHDADDMDWENETSLWKLLTEIAIRHCDKHNKRAQRQAKRNPTHVPIRPGFEPDNDKRRSNAPDVSAVTIAADIVKTVREGLKPREKQVLDCKLAEMSEQEIVDALRVSKATVQRQWSKIKKKFEELD
jgi:DNA-directed RNA polymerase specialized sigma subunit